MDARELTRAERAAIRRLVKRWCANYDPEYGCLPLDCECYMLNKWWTGAYCRYFREAVLPLAPELARALSGPGHKAELRACAVCGRLFPRQGKRAFCSDACKEVAKRKRQREYMRRQRTACGHLGPENPCKQGLSGAGNRVGNMISHPTPCFAEKKLTFGKDTDKQR